MKRRSPPLNVLIVEDEALLAMDIETMIQDAGHNVIGEAASLYEVQDMSVDLNLDLALVDIHLAKGTNGFDVSALIQKRWKDAVVIFVTANPLKIPKDYAGAYGVIPKPFSRNGLISAIHYIEQGICNPPPVVPNPPSFTAAPAFAASWGG